MRTQLNIPRGITALLGSGGKTTLMMRLAQELPGRRIVCTSTRIYRPPLPLLPGDDLGAVSDLLSACGVLCVGLDAPGGKLRAPACSFAALAARCDYLLVEADGSRRLPLKAHLPNEPVLPPETDRTLLLAGLWGLGQPIQAAAHRPERFALLCGKPMSAKVVPEDLAAVLRAEALADTVILTRPDAGEDDALARRVAGLLPATVLTGSVAAGGLRLLTPGASMR